MTPNLTPEQIDALVAKLKADPVGKIECEFPDNPYSAGGRAWIYFLRRAAELVPGFIEELFALHRLGDPLPSERALNRWARSRGLMGQTLISGKVRVRPLPLVISWARNALVEHDARTPTVVYVPKAFKPPPPRLDAWHCDRASRQQYRTYVNDFIDHYMNGVKAQAMAAGAQPPTLEKHEQLHFDYLARFQIGRETVPAIAKSLTVHLTARQKQARVRKGINDLAASLGLMVRRPA